MAGSSESDGAALTPVPRRRAAHRAGLYREADGDIDDLLKEEKKTERVLPDDHWDANCSKCKQKKDAASARCSFQVGANACSKVYHLACLDPPLTKPPKGKWYCPDCVRKEELKSLERFLAVRYADGEARSVKGSSARVRPRELYCKWQDMSYIHCEWQPEAWVVEMSSVYPGLKQRYRNFLSKLEQRGGMEGLERDDEENGLENGVDPQWLCVDRIIACEEDNGVMMYLCKWRGLEYEHCTWEEAADLEDFPEEMAAFRALQATDEVAATLKAQYEASLKSGPNASRKDARTFTETPACLPGGVLHPYQLDGLNWLLLRYARKQNMILADEMGLGKTVQSIAFIACLREMGVPKPHLVVVPLSTMPNWERELAKWAPQLYVVSIKGSQVSRDTIRKYEHHVTEPQGKVSKKDKNRNLRFNVILTTYETVQQEVSWMSGVEWATLTVDEGHRLKNAKSKLFMLLKDFKVERRLLLTGTPLQNNLDELFFLMSFIEPGKFDSLAAFQEKFAHIAKQEQVEKLHDMLATHILRRVKKDVLKQLPPKRESIVRVELSRQQQAFYKQILIKQYPALSGKDGQNATGFLKNVMMELRKCCNHPYLFEGAEEEAAELDSDAALTALVQASGKLELLDRMMVKFKEQGNRVLIYSQFTRTLDILESWLSGRQWAYQRIDGGIRGPDRQQRIDKFNTQPDTYWVFLLSTRAGGLGINLATADTVVIFDSDWNPHNDIQAQARAHRLGQLKPVFTFRFVTRGTVEERLMQRAKQKRMLETVVMGRSDMKQSDLDDILRYGAMDLFMDDEDESGEGENAGAASASGKDGSAPMDVDGASKEKRERKRIVYDEAALAKLLDREAALAVQQEEEEDNEFMAAFKVADFELSEAEAAALAEKEKASAEASKETAAQEGKFWDALLKEHFVDGQEQEQAMLGRGRRRKPKVSYVEADEDGKPVQKRKREDEGSESEEWRPDEREEDQVPIYNEEAPTSPLFTVYGFTQRLRNEFMRFIMSFGLPFGAGRFDWDAFARKVTKLHALSSCSPDDLQSYGKLLLHILSNETPSASSDAPLVALPGTGRNVPREIFFMEKYRAPEILSRIGALHLIRVKLADTQGQPEEEFHVNGGSNADTRWFMQQTSLMLGWQDDMRRKPPQIEAWTPAHDRRLLQGVLRHGAMAFVRPIVNDVTLGVTPCLRTTLGLPDYDDFGATAAAAAQSAAASGDAANSEDEQLAGRRADDSGAAASTPEKGGADAGDGGKRARGAATRSSCGASAADVQRYKNMEAQFLKARFEMLVHELTCEYAKRPPAELKYPGNVTSQSPLLDPGLGAHHLTTLSAAASGCEAAHLAIQDHTRKAVGATHPQAMTDAAARFRSLVNEYNARIRSMHQAALSALGTMMEFNQIPATCLLERPAQAASASWPAQNRQSPASCANAAASSPANGQQQRSNNGSGVRRSGSAAEGQGLASSAPSSHPMEIIE